MRAQRHDRYREAPQPRYALVASSDAEQVARYLPSSYRVVGTVEDGTHVLIEGHDYSGWTLDGYVIPRLASGLLFAAETSLVVPA